MYNVMDPGQTCGLNNAKGDTSELQSSKESIVAKIETDMTLIKLPTA